MCCCPGDAGSRPTNEQDVLVANVAVIGAGVAGLCAAYRLRQRGHQVTILEAKSHAGGISQSVRGGDVITELDDDGHEIRQTVRLDEGLYVNSGPGRLPHHHRRILGLCHELGVALEPYIMCSDANYYADARSGQRYRRRRIENDARGHIAELAYSSDDPDALQEMVTAFGDLDKRGRYRGTPRAGEGPPVPVGLLSKLRFWQHRFWQPITYLWQDTMFQPCGGMDAIWRALLPHVADSVIYNAAVTRIRTGKSGVKVAWVASGDKHDAEFDWCASTIPLPHLSQRVRMDGFSREYRDAVAVPEFAPACKVGWQSQSRWWQNETEQIYGGISYTNHAIQQFWYPSTDFTDDKATLTGAYAAYGAAEKLGRRGIGDRIAAARRGGALIHSEVADEELLPGGKAVTVAWHRVPYQAGGWCDWQPDRASHAEAFAVVQRPDGRFIAIGDQVTVFPGWQEGCVLSADRAVAHVQGVAPRAGDAPSETVPDAAWLTMGDHPWGSQDVVI